MRRLKALLPMILLCCILAGISFLGMSLTGCNSVGDMKNAVSEGRILRTAHGEYLFIDKNNSPISMSDGSKKGNLFEGLTDGDLVRLRHGLVAESYPGQAAAYSLEKLEDGELSDLPRELLETLTEMGWVSYTAADLDQIYALQPAAPTGGLEEIPSLTVLFQQDQARSMRGTSSWHYPKGEQLIGIEADSLHPLQCEWLPTLPSFSDTSANASADHSADSSESLTAYLLFETAPDEVIAECWSYQLWSQAGSQWDSLPDFWNRIEEEKQSVQVTSCQNPAGAQFRLQLKEEPSVYQIIAKWNDPTKGGTVYYSFCTSLSDGETAFSTPQ